MRQQFSTYLSIVQGEGEHLANNVLFWVEVQRFKVGGAGRGVVKGTTTLGCAELALLQRVPEWCVTYQLLSRGTEPKEQL